MLVSLCSGVLKSLIVAGGKLFFRDAIKHKLYLKQKMSYKDYVAIRNLQYHPCQTFLC